MAQSLNSEFQIGSIVTLKSHYTRGEKDYLDNISIAGDDKSISPYMMVTEILKETKNKFDEDTGENTIQKNSFRLKVIWFNAKTYEFNKKWISSQFVDVVENELKNIKFSKADQVILKTNQLEIKKKRISIKEEEWNTKISKSSLLSFCAPEMIVLGKSKFKPKDPHFDKVTNERIREIPTDQVKVQFYNPLTDKYSEHILPVECFEKADVKTNKLTQLIEATKDEKSLVGFKDQLYRVKNISYLHGIYMIQTKNFVDETVESFMLHEIVNLKELKINDVIGEKLAPRWQGSNFKKIPDFINKQDIKYEDYITKSKEEKENIRPSLTGNLFYINYRNLKGKFTQRFIKIEAVSEFPIKEEKVDGAKGLMVKAFCFLRKEERTFTFTDDRLLAIYDVKNESQVNSNKLKFKELLENIKQAVKNEDT